MRRTLPGTLLSTPLSSTLLAAALLGAALLPGGRAWADEVHTDATLVLQVDDRDAAAAALIERARARGGWFSRLEAEAVTFRLPSAGLKPFLEEARGLGRAVDRSFNTQDLSAQLRDSRAHLKANEEILERYLEVLGTAKADSVVMVGAQVSAIVAEIEATKGRIRRLEDEAAFATTTVSFQFRDRRAPAPASRSAFPWINTVSLPRLLQSFQTDDGGDVRRRGAKSPIPTGFAPYRERRSVRATSPDGVVYALRVEKNKPEADLAFWKEALESHLKGAGYLVLGRADLEAGGMKGALLELGAPSGDRDFAWTIALFVEGRRLYVVEAAGESRAFAARKEAVMAAIRGLDG